jgi:hypothetical protein
VYVCYMCMVWENRVCIVSDGCGTCVILFGVLQRTRDETKLTTAEELDTNLEEAQMIAKASDSLLSWLSR